MKLLLLTLLLSLLSTMRSIKLSSFTKNLKTIPSIISLSLLLNIQQSNAIEIEKAPKAGTCITTSNPSFTQQFCRQLGLVDNRLRSCQANENCFSTSSKSATKYLSPWQYEFSTSSSSKSSSSTSLEDEVWDNLKIACQANGLKILQDKNDGNQRYLLAAEKGSSVPKQPAGSSLFYEFTLRPNEKLILYREVVDKTIFLYPLQQPVSDFDALKSKLNSIRDSAKFLQIGSSDNDDALLLD